MEGAEYASLAATPDSVFQSIDQIVIELHDIYLGNLNVIPLLKKLTSMYSLIHMHANCYGGTRGYCGVLVPRVLELTFVKKDTDREFTIINPTFPLEYDRPNNGKQEVDLNAFYQYD